METHPGSRGEAMFVFCSGMWTLQATPCSPDSMLHSESLEHGGDFKPHLEAEWFHLQPLPFCLQAWFCSRFPYNVGSSKSSSWMRTLGTE